MKKLLLFLILAILTNLVHAQQNDSRLTSEFDKLLSQIFKPNEPGATVLVSKKGSIIYNKAFGMANMEFNVPMQVDNIFKLGSVTKQFTAVAILQLMEQGRLTLSDNITKYLTGYPDQGAVITIEHLLTHTSGIIDYTNISDTVLKAANDYTPPQIIDIFKNQPLRFAPGTRWEYSNSNYFLLGYIIEKLSGKTYAEYLHDVFFKPLAMTNSYYANDIPIINNRVDGYTRNERGYENVPFISMTIPYAAGSILSTSGDLFKWQQAVLSGKLLRKENLKKAITKYKLSDGKETAYGYGWRLGNVYESPSIWHGGLIRGFRTMALYLPKEDVYVTVLSNCETNSITVLTSRVAALASGKPYDYKEILIDKAILPDYTGVYENESGQQLIITSADNKLFLQYNRSPKSQLKAFQKDQFFINELETLDFTRNEKGTVQRVISKKLAGNEVWNKTNKSIPSEDGLRVDNKILEKYVGQYEMNPNFSFTVSLEEGKLFLQASGQEKIQMFAETPSKFFLKVNDALIEFIQDNTGNVIKVILNQGGRNAEAKKIK